MDAKSPQECYRVRHRFGSKHESLLDTRLRFHDNSGRKLCTTSVCKRRDSCCRSLVAAGFGLDDTGAGVGLLVLLSLLLSSSRPTLGSQFRPLLAPMWLLLLMLSWLLLSWFASVLAVACLQAAGATLAARLSLAIDN